MTFYYGRYTSYVPVKNGARAYFANVRERMARDEGFKTVADVHANKYAGIGPNASNNTGNSPPDFGIIVPTSAYDNAPQVASTPHPNHV